jgi:hypothetical protein
MSKQTKLISFMKNYEVSETNVEEAIPSTSTRNAADNIPRDLLSQSDRKSRK